VLPNRSLPGFFASSWLTTTLSCSSIAFKSNRRHNCQSFLSASITPWCMYQHAEVKFGGGKIITFSLWMRSCIINHKTCFSLQGFLILKNFTEGVSSVQTHIYKVLQYIYTFLWHINQTERADEAELLKA
jgi:hypothetical protein